MIILDFRNFDDDIPEVYKGYIKVFKIFGTPFVAQSDSISILGFFGMVPNKFL